jgi:hypothetical protein
MPGLLHTLSDFGWEIHILCPPLPREAETELGFPPLFLDKIHFHEAGTDSDSLEWIRKFLTRFGFSRDKSFLEQIKSTSDKDIVRGGVSNLFHLLMTFFAFPDLERNWKKHAIKKGLVLCNEHNFDVLFSSSPFPTSHVVANKLTKAKTSKWVADFRDPWSLNPVYSYGKLRKFIEMRYEKKIIKKANAITTVSAQYASLLEEIHGITPEVIPNGFIDYGNRPKQVQKNEKITIVHTGNIYEGNHDLSKLFRAISVLVSDNLIASERYQFLFYGRYEMIIQDLIEKYELEGIVFQMGHRPRLECIDIQRNADALIFFNWENQKESGLSHLKFYEYLASGTKILVVGKSMNTYTQIIERLEAGEVYESTREIVEGFANLRNVRHQETERAALREYGYAHQASRLNSFLLIVLRLS